MNTAFSAADGSSAAQLNALIVTSARAAKHRRPRTIASATSIGASRFKWQGRHLVLGEDGLDRTLILFDQ